MPAIKGLERRYDDGLLSNQMQGAFFVEKQFFSISSVSQINYPSRFMNYHYQIEDQRKLLKLTRTKTVHPC